MFQRLSEYLTSLGILFALALLYQSAADRWLRPPEVSSVPMADRSPMRTHTSLAGLFEEGAWQRGDCKKIQTPDAVLMFDDLTRGEDNLMTLSPVTIVYGYTGDGQLNSSRTLIMEAEKAEILLSESIDPSKLGERAPPIKTGNLLGAVRIRTVNSEWVRDPSTRQRSTDADRKNADLDVRTSNISIDRRRVWTTSPLEMSFGEAKLRGRDLTLHLVASAGSSISGDDSIVDRMELIYLDELVIPMDEATGSVLRMTCADGIDYDFAVHELSLHESVSFVHETRSGKPDRFICDELRLTLRDPFNEKLTRSGPLDWIDEVWAVGSPLNPVSFSMPSRALQLVTDGIHLDAAAGLLEAGAMTLPSNRSAAKHIPVSRNASDKTAPVTIGYAEVAAGLQSLEYQFDPRNPRSLVRLTASGAGRMRLQAEGVPLRQLQWRDVLEIKPSSPPHSDPAPGSVLNNTPVDHSTLHANNDATNERWRFDIRDLQVNVDGQVRASLADGGQFSCQYVRCDLGPSRYTRPGEAPTLVPTDFLAKENVVLDSPAIRVATDELMLKFLEQPGSFPSHRLGQRQADSVAQPGGVVAQPASASTLANANSPVRRWVMQPSGSDGPVEPVSRPAPRIQGRQIIAKLAFSDGNLTVDDLSVRDDVQMNHIVNVGEQSLDAVMRGSQLRLVNQAGHDTISLFSNEGIPARLDLGDGYFVGPAIHIRPSENVVEIRNAGEFQMPTAILPAGTNWISAPRCSFAGNMNFDGENISLHGGVRIRGEILQGDTPWKMELQGDTLRARLTAGVQLSDIKTLRNANLSEVTILAQPNQSVVVEAISLTTSGETQSRHVMRAPALTFLPGNAPGHSERGYSERGQSGPINVGPALDGPARDGPALGGQLIGQGPGAYWAWTLQEVRKDKRDSPSGTARIRPRNTREAAQLANASRGSGFESSDETSTATQLTGIHLTFYDRLVGQLDKANLTFFRNVRIGMRPVASWEDAVNVHAMQELKDGELTAVCERLRIAVDPASVSTADSDSHSIRHGFASSPDSPSWEMYADGGVLFRNQKDESGLMEVAASQASYSSSKDSLTLNGAPGKPMKVQRSFN
ncbi:MAG: hypothetical protein AAF989_03205, partial [Planctomycetota bacterium]